MARLVRKGGLLVVLTGFQPDDAEFAGRGLHSCTFQLKLSRFLSLTPTTDTQYPSKRAYVELKRGRVQLSPCSPGGTTAATQRTWCSMQRRLWQGGY